MGTEAAAEKTAAAAREIIEEAKRSGSVSGRDLKAVEQAADTIQKQSQRTE